ncbi:hypothetical protein LCGC14_0354270 [marine sediment metagenome]|uniref:Uncharacterized protein n=1 Tax=marine sediment metagenome TaxID=412755 RepID=A0A0F9TSR4_9ZZZZ|nr:hypothetical protein [Maribacter sp.]HDZ04679.1 carboxypeptidase regulatory-like domain-containing protein [Maribacter sp.]
MENPDKKINFILKKLNHLDFKNIVPLLLKKGFDRQGANDLVKFLEEHNLAILVYSNELRFKRIPESTENVQLKDLFIKAKITPKGKTYLKENRRFVEKIFYNYKTWVFYVLPTTLILLFITNYTNPWAFGKESSSMDFTVFVHGSKGVDDLILKNEGKVILILKSDKREASINEKGEATFKEIPAYFNNKKVNIFIEHPQPYRPTHLDSLYEINDKASIFLEVELYNTELIYGQIMDSGTNIGVDSVRVSIRDIFTFSDNHGYYELKIPKTYQKKFQNVRFEKSGFVPLERKNIPVHTEQSLDILIKQIDEN